MKHGGDISRAMAEFGDGPGKAWLDLSTGIAPEPYPLPDIPSAVWQQLPQAGDYARLLEAAKSAYGASDTCPIVAAPGTQLLIQLLPLLRPDADVRVLGPTYSEHAISWQRTARQVSVVVSIEALSGADVAIVTNPNNPDGRIIAPEGLHALAAQLADRGGLLIVDEAFADVDPTISAVPNAGQPGLVILRSFGKFFGLAGVRLGFALGDSKEISALEQLLGPWAVPGPALVIGVQALGDSNWSAVARRRYQEQSQKLDTLLSSFGLELVGGTSLFRLFAHKHAATVHRQLARAGILTRVFENEPTRMRFGLPGSAENFRRLEQCLQSALRPTAAK
ncbi:MAG: threonine-phosphate decarboxylase CobD [Pseudomonadota bacterium]